MAKVEIYTTATCPYCYKAKQLLDNKHVKYIEIPVDTQPEKRQEMQQRGGRHTVPQIFIDGKAIGGCDDLHALDAKGKLDALLS
ncbi:MAG: glutaredoxin 3 [Gammaproteobacteria bacterium]